MSVHEQLFSVFIFTLSMDTAVEHGNKKLWPVQTHRPKARLAITID